MNQIFVSLEKAETIILGRQGEKNSTTVIWNISKWLNDFGTGMATLLYTLEGAEDEPYPCQVTVDGNSIKWLITPCVLMLGSRGKCQLVYAIGSEIVAKSPVYMTRVQSSLGEKSSEPPEKFTGWVDSVLQAGAEAEKAADSAVASKISAKEAAQDAQQSAVQAAQSALQLVDTVQTAALMVENAVAASTAANSAAQTVTEKEETISRYVQVAQAACEAAQQASTDTAAHEALSAANAQAAQTAAQDAKNAVPPVTKGDNGKIMMVLDGKWAARDLPYHIDRWEDIQKIVRMGAAARYFPIGYEFVTHDRVQNTDIIWRVVGYDTIKAVDESLNYSMILETKYVYSDSNGAFIRLQMDGIEALYYAETGLEAGTYHFTLPEGIYTEYGGGKTYSFTLSRSVPVGGSVLLNWAYNQPVLSSKIHTYESSKGVVLESVTVTEGSEGVNLGVADGSTKNMNHVQRLRLGSNNYAQSALRQWLNGIGNFEEFWAPQTIWDMPNTYKPVTMGFMSGLPEDFLSVVQTASIACRTNSVFEMDSLDRTVFSTNQTYTVEDKFFILSQPEIYGTWDDPTYKDGEQVDFYKGLTDSERIKYDPIGSAQSTWIRSVLPSRTDAQRLVSSNGTLAANSTTGCHTISPACIIA